MGRRIRWLGLVLVVCFAAVLAQLVNIQMRQASALDASPANPRNAQARLDNYRGEILAAPGTVLAKSVSVKDRQAGTLEYHRTYPGGSLYAGIVGYDSGIYGTGGIENVYNTQLSLHSQSAKTLGQLLTPPPKTADDVVLTIQPTLQVAAAQALAEYSRGNKDGAVVVLNPKTGAVLAMYSNPTYTPDALAQATAAAQKAAWHADFQTPDPEGFYPGRPMATADRFLPGSTFKVVTTSAVYNLKPTLAGFTWGPGKCTKTGTIPGTTVQVCNDADTASNASTCGGTIRQMLPESCDPGYVVLGIHVGGTAMAKQADLFGINSAPPIDLTATDVAKSHFPTAATFVTGPTHIGIPGLGQASFGQGTSSLTPLQNALNVAAVADTGAIMTPHLMSQIRSTQGQLVEQYKPTVYKQAMSATAAQQVKIGMEAVVATPAGTAYGVFTPADQVAAKTGTAQTTGSTHTQTNDWMVAFAPATDPTVAVAVCVPFQSKAQYGATTAGPIANVMIKDTLAEEEAHNVVPTTTPTSIPPVSATSTGTAATKGVTAVATTAHAVTTAHATYGPQAATAPSRSVTPTKAGTGTGATAPSTTTAAPAPVGVGPAATAAKTTERGPPATPPSSQGSSP